MIELEAAEEWIEESATVTKIWNKIDRELAEELNKYELLTKLIHKRITKEIERKLMGDTTIEQLATKWFGLEVDRHYLERRDDMESVSFRIVRNKNKGTILEIYQRLQHEEEDWGVISERWGIEPEKLYEGKYNLTPARQISKEIRNHLERLKKGEISEPIRIGKHYAILRLEKWQKLELDDEMRKNLETEMMTNWISKQTENIISKKT